MQGVQQGGAATWKSKNYLSSEVTHSSCGNNYILHSHINEDQPPASEKEVGFFAATRHLVSGKRSLDSVYREIQKSEPLRNCIRAEYLKLIDIIPQDTQILRTTLIQNVLDRCKENQIPLIDKSGRSLGAMDEFQKEAFDIFFSKLAGAAMLLEGPDVDTLKIEERYDDKHEFFVELTNDGKIQVRYWETDSAFVRHPEIRTLISIKWAPPKVMVQPPAIVHTTIEEHITPGPITVTTVTAPIVSSLAMYQQGMPHPLQQQYQQPGAVVPVVTTHVTNYAPQPPLPLPGYAGINPNYSAAPVVQVQQTTNSFAPSGFNTHSQAPYVGQPTTVPNQTPMSYPPTGYPPTGPSAAYPAPQGNYIQPYQTSTNYPPAQQPYPGQTPLPPTYGSYPTNYPTNYPYNPQQGGTLQPGSNYPTNTNYQHYSGQNPYQGYPPGQY